MGICNIANKLFLANIPIPALKLQFSFLVLNSNIFIYTYLLVIQLPKINYGQTN